LSEKLALPATSTVAEVEDPSRMVLVTVSVYDQVPASPIAESLSVPEIE
jgi:hypothetical protein